MPFKTIRVDQMEAFRSGLKAGSYNLLLGAGASMDAKNELGDLPGGNALKNNLCKIKDVSEAYSLQRVFSLLNSQEVNEHVFQRFVNCVPGPTAKLISSFVWKRIFTWNIDDVLENAYDSKEARQELISLHFSDDYAETSTLAELLLVHLHGSVKTPDKGYVFSRNEYINQIRNISHWMTVLTQFMQTEPLIISGTSLDEIDLDFYLSHRTLTSSRDDRGPSILVEMNDDAVTQDLCRRHNLLHFVGHSHEFFSYCDQIIPNRPTPIELIPYETQRLLPAETPKASALAFHSDFEIVPATAQQSDVASRFLYGHSPSWDDLASNLDISRSVVGRIIVDVERRLQDADLARLILITENAGFGKTTILRRVAFELAGRGVRCLFCSALSRIDFRIISLIDLIDGPLVIFVDNLSDQASSISDLITRLEKKDLVIVAAERAYRLRYLRQVLGDGSYHVFQNLSLYPDEASRLIDIYAKFGLVGGQKRLSDTKQLHKGIVGDPIAVACCRIMNEFKPLDRIAQDLAKDSNEIELKRYLLVAIAQHCFMGGLRYEIYASRFGELAPRSQFDTQHPLPLTFAHESKSFVITENATIAERVLALTAGSNQTLLLEVFVALANGVAPRVNRRMIIRRTPEAKLSGRLFDYDDVVRRFLGSHSVDFYARTRTAWTWNSRYWEQVALLNLATYYERKNTSEGDSALESAVQHARHAVSVELHPFTLSTLGKILMARMLSSGDAFTAIYSEAFDKLIKAIELEASWARSAVQPYVSLFNGAIGYLDRGGVHSSRQLERLKTVIIGAESRFVRDVEVQETLEKLRSKIVS